MAITLHTVMPAEISAAIAISSINPLIFDSTRPSLSATRQTGLATAIGSTSPIWCAIDVT